MASDEGCTLQDHFMRKVQKQLDAIESIREDLTAEGISVPGVVVVGAQSAGKSSVLESLSGIQLPRGETITTRVPLMLRLENDPAMQPGEFKAFISKAADMEGSEEVPAEHIAHMVRQYTNELVGDGGAVQDCPIHLKVMRKDSPNITLIDLPGIAYNSADENIGGDIAQMTKSLIEKYIQSPDVIIVVVVPAADDFGAHESIKMASIHDPAGLRTLGVVTKTDRIETGNGFAAKMRAEGAGHIKLKLGYVAVKNRNQQEVDAGLTLDDARRGERLFFESDPHVRDLDRENWGMDTVIERIVEIQSQKVSEFIPKVRKLVMNRIGELEEAIKKLPPTFASVHERRTYLIDLVQQLVNKFRDLATAREIPCGSDDEHLAVASNMFKLYKDFSVELQDSIPDFLGDEYQEKLEGMVSRTMGGSLSNFLSHPVFSACIEEGFIKPLTSFSGELAVKAQEYVTDTFRCLLEVKTGRTAARTSHPIPKMMGASMQLRNVVMQETMEFLKEREAECQAHLATRSKAEEFIFTLDGMYGKTIEDLKHEGERDDHHDWNFIRKFTGVAEAFVSMFRGGDNETKALCEMQASLKAYVRIRSRSADDDVAKIIRHFLVRSLMDDLPNHLYKSIPDEKLAELMAEDFAVARDRAKFTASLGRFQRARDTLKNMV